MRPLSGATDTCLGTLAVRLGGTQLIATALGPAASVRWFAASVELTDASE